MTTYPLSEPATIYADDGAGQKRAAGKGSLAECADRLADFPPEQRKSARIEMDTIDLRFGPPEIEELLAFLREEDEGLSNQQIAEIADPES